MCVRIFHEKILQKKLCQFHFLMETLAELCKPQKWCKSLKKSISISYGEGLKPKWASQNNNQRKIYRMSINLLIVINCVILSIKTTIMVHALQLLWFEWNCSLNNRHKLCTDFMQRHMMQLQWVTHNLTQAPFCKQLSAEFIRWIYSWDFCKNRTPPRSTSMSSRIYTSYKFSW